MGKDASCMLTAQLQKEREIMYNFFLKTLQFPLLPWKKLFLRLKIWCWAGIRSRASVFTTSHLHYKSWSQLSRFIFDVKPGLPLAWYLPGMILKFLLNAQYLEEAGLFHHIHTAFPRAMSVIFRIISWRNVVTHDIYIYTYNVYVDVGLYAYFK